MPGDPGTSSLSATELTTARRGLDDTNGLQKPTRRSIPESVASTRIDRADKSVAADRILAATQPEEVVAALSHGECLAAAHRIQDIHEMTRDGAPEEAAIVIDSLRELALFLLSQHQHADPEIGLSPDGLLLAEWVSAGRGVLTMKFLPDGIIQYAGISAAERDGPRLRVHGKLPRDGTLGAVRAFMPPLNGSNTAPATA